MRTHITKIGNSRGVILPRHLIVESNIRHLVTITRTNEGILIKSADKPREDWEEAFIKAGAREDNEKAFPSDMSNKADEDWTW